MSKRKVSTSKTTGYRNWLTGQYVQTTRTYVEEPRQPGRSKTSRTLARTGISPWDPRRALITAWVVLLLVTFGAAKWAGIVFVLLSTVAFAGWKWYQRSEAERRAVEAARPPKPLPGGEWCDHCADWTVHPTNRHQVAWPH